MACSGKYSMSFGFGLEADKLDPKVKFRWIFELPGVSADSSSTVESLPPRRSSRPGLSFKEQEFQHLNESIYVPMKPDWKPIPLHLYDTRCKRNAVFDWISLNEKKNRDGIYNPEKGTFRPCVSSGFKRDGRLKMLSGCGEVVETWVFDGCYPQNIEWGELDMESNEIVTVDITLRYDRAYIISSTNF